MRRPKPTAESKARAERIARALAGMLEEPAMVRDPTTPEQRTIRAADGGGLMCPCCAEAMQSVGTGHGIEVDQCAACGAVWLDAGELATFLESASGEASSVTPVGSVSELRARMTTVVPQEAAVRYRECPRCGEVMGRRNFGTISGVVIDECNRHGVLLDEGEMQAIEAFVRMGGPRLGEQARREQALRSMPPPPEQTLYRPGEVSATVQGAVLETAADSIWRRLFGW